MKNKFYSVLLMGTLFLSLIGCNDNSEKQYTQAVNISTSKETNEDIIKSDAPSSEEYKTNETLSEEETQTVLNNEDVLVEYRGISEYSSTSWVINLYVENKTEKELYVSVNDAIVNDYNITIANSNQSIPAGSKYLARPNFDYIIDTEKLVDCGIEKMTNISFTIDIREDRIGEDIYEEKVSSTLSKDVPNSTGETKISNGQILLENDDVLVSYCGISKYSDTSWILDLYMENKSDTEKYLDIDDLLINGYSIGIANGNYAVPPHCKFFSLPNFQYIIEVEDLEAYDISNIETIDFLLNITNEWVGNAIYSVPVNLVL